MNRSELEARIAARTRIAPMIVSEVLAVAFAEMFECIARGEKVRHSGFGSFSVRERPERDIFDPYRGCKTRIGPTRQVVFTPSRSLTTSLNAADK